MKFLINIKNCLVDTQEVTLPKKHISILYFYSTINFPRSNIKMIKIIFSVHFIISICFQPFKSCNIIIRIKIKEYNKIREKNRSSIITWIETSNMHLNT